MFLLLQPNDFNIKNIYFLEKKSNKLMEGFFIKIIFTNSFMTMNGIFLKLTIQKFPLIQKASYFLQFDPNYHKELITRLSIIEKQLLLYYINFYNIQKTPVYNLKNQLQNGSVKYYRPFYKEDAYKIQSMEGSYYIKISGIWENQYEIGITFKILED
jgi:hypothetical protein